MFSVITKCIQRVFPYYQLMHECLHTLQIKTTCFPKITKCIQRVFPFTNARMSPQFANKNYVCYYFTNAHIVGTHSILLELRTTMRVDAGSNPAQT